MHKRGKTVFWIVVVALIAALAALAFYEQPILVEVEEASRQPMTVSIVEEGRTRLRHHFDVVAPISGRMERIELHVGDELERGDPVTDIYPAAAPLLDARSRAEARSSVDAAEAAVAAAEAHQAAVDAEAELAKTELDRAEAVFRERRISEIDIERLRSAYRQAVAHVRQAEHETLAARSRLAAARAVLARYDTPENLDQPLTVAAPVTGIVMAVLRESEGPINAGEKIITLGQRGDLELAVDLLSADAVRVSPGGGVLLHRWGGDEPLAAVVDHVEPVGFTKVSALGVEEQRVLVICQFVSPPSQWQRLGDGYRVEAEFILWSGDDVLQVPSSSLFRSGEGWAVFVAQDERAVLTPVEPGRRAGLRTEIRSGLVAGDRVIAHPDERLTDGTRITFPGS